MFPSFLSFLASVPVAEGVSKFMSQLEPSAGEALPLPAAHGTRLQLSPSSVLGHKVTPSSIRCPNLKAFPFVQV